MTVIGIFEEDGFCFSDCGERSFSCRGEFSAGLFFCVPTQSVFSGFFCSISAFKKTVEYVLTDKPAIQIFTVSITRVFQHLVRPFRRLKGLMTGRLFGGVVGHAGRALRL